MKPIREIDDLELIDCSTCRGTGKLLGGKARCPNCNGTGDRVVRRVKFYEPKPKVRRAAA